MKLFVLFCFVTGMLFLFEGCIHNSPRNQYNKVYVEKAEVNIRDGATNAVPAVINIGTAANDQMIDQGAENSGGQGNRTPVNLSIPNPATALGGAASGAAEGATKGIGSWFGGGKKDAAGADDCADGDCEVAP
jgi:hypothetical protein